MANLARVVFPMPGGPDIRAPNFPSAPAWGFHFCKNETSFLATLLGPFCPTHWSIVFGAYFSTQGSLSAGLIGLSSIGLIASMISLEFLDCFASEFWYSYNDQKVAELLLNKAFESFFNTKLH